MNFSKALDKTLEEFGISAKWLSERSGVSQQMISGFRNGKQKVYSDSLEKMLNALPGEAREYFLDELEGRRNLGLAHLIEQANDEEIEAALLAIGRKWKENMQNMRSRHKSEDFSDAIAV